ncbi:MAG: class I SAM-dependent methyltransferase [Archangium sp.]|nr:class I SAM-dependent methyltransferase [Archangium sp.]
MTAPTTTEGESPFFGELYLRSTRPFLSDVVTGAEVTFLDQKFNELPVEGPVLDVGCGHGRHLRHLQGKVRPYVGLDLDAGSLLEVCDAAPVTRGDFFRLPFRDGAFAGAYAWYNTLFTFDDVQHGPLFSELARCLKPGGGLIFHNSYWAWAAAQPISSYDNLLPDGSRLVENVTYDATRGRDDVRRELHLPDGRVMAATFFIRYYPIERLEVLLHDAGLDMVWTYGGLEGQDVHDGSPDVIVGAVKRGEP